MAIERTVFSVKKENIILDVHIIPMGDDLQVCVTGGDRPHVGAVTVASFDCCDTQPSSDSSTDVTGEPSCSLSVSTVVLPGHKDNYISDYLAKKLADELHVSVSVSCGVHFDSFSMDIVDTIDLMLPEMLKKIIDTQH